MLVFGIATWLGQRWLFPPHRSRPIGWQCLPHFSNEPPRKRAFEQQIANGRLAAGLAIDDGVAIHICDGVVTNIISARGLRQMHILCGATEARLK